MKKFNPFSWKVRQNIQNHLSLKSSSKATLRLTVNILHVWNQKLFPFSKRLSGKIKSVLWESKAKLENYLNENYFICSFLKNRLRVYCKKIYKDSWRFWIFSFKYLAIASLIFTWYNMRKVSKNSNRMAMSYKDLFKNYCRKKTIVKFHASIKDFIWRSKYYMF